MESLAVRTSADHFSVNGFDWLDVSAFGGSVCAAAESVISLETEEEAGEMGRTMA